MSTCIHGHVIRSAADRYASNGACRACDRETSRERQRAYRADARRYREIKAMMLAS